MFYVTQVISTDLERRDRTEFKVSPLAFSFFLPTPVYPGDYVSKGPLAGIRSGEAFEHRLLNKVVESPCFHERVPTRVLSDVRAVLRIN